MNFVRPKTETISQRVTIESHHIIFISKIPFLIVSIIFRCGDRANRTETNYPLLPRWLETSLAGKAKLNSQQSPDHFLKACTASQIV